MIRLIFFTLLFGLITYGCKKDDDYEFIPNLDSYYYGYMDYTFSPCLPNPEENGIVKIEYSGSNVVRRVGGLIPINSMIGYDYTFSKNVYDEITYIGNLAKIKSRYISGKDTFLIKDWEVLFNSIGKILIKIQPGEYSSWHDTLKFFYNLYGLIKKTKNFSKYYNEESTFFYNKRNNIDSIVTVRYIHDKMYNKVVEFFTDYDEAPNPLKNLTIFNETFNRSLSQNNYKYYSKKEYNSNNNLIHKEERINDLFYDSSGIPQFDK